MKSQKISLHLNVITLFISNFVSKIRQFQMRKVQNNQISLI